MGFAHLWSACLRGGSGVKICFRILAWNFWEKEEEMLVRKQIRENTLLFQLPTPRTKETLHIDRDGRKRIKGTRTSEYVPTKSHNISRNNENYSHEQLYPVTDLLQKK